MSSSHTLLTRALEAGPAEQGDEIHERILDAALVEGESKGLERITMDAVAARAKVGRMTVYRRFGSKEDLTAALARREATRGLVTIAAAVDLSKSIPEQVADGFVASLAVAAGHPLLQRAARFEPELLLASFNDPSDPLFSMLRGFVAGQITATAGDQLRADAEEVAELLVRIGLSYLLIPDGIVDVNDERSARRLAETLIAPIVV